MYTTQNPPTFQQLGHWKRRENLLDAPNLDGVPDSMHGLYANIRKCRYVKYFQQNLVRDKIVLTLFLRDGEIINEVVKSRVANLFRKHSPKIEFSPGTMIVKLNYVSP